MTETPTLRAAVLVSQRRAYQLLRLMDLGDGDGVSRLLGAVDGLGEWAMLGGALRTLQELTARQLPDGLQLPASMVMNHVATVGDSARDLDDVRAWVLHSAKLVVDFLTEQTPEQADRLRFYEERARTAFELEEKC